MRYLSFLLLGLLVLLIVLVVRHDAGTVLGMEIGSFARLGVMAAFIAFIGIGAFRGTSVSKNIRHAGIWLGLAASLLVGYSYKDDARAMFARVAGGLVPGMAFTSHSDNSVIITRGQRGHYSVRALINDVPIDMLVDTGASSVVLSAQDAARAGYDLNTLAFTLPVQTANGEAFVSVTRIERIEIGSINIENVAGAIAQPGKLGQSLLGISFLDRLSSYEFSGQNLTLRP
ncbi:MAG: TIGR02281 family clan AA aspartic protease [Hyphomicrobiales bacterium]|nr:MAG: TIGR02281 family clan AA aspartic protease [Hyphomicrobiales bacterium]